MKMIITTQNLPGYKVNPYFLISSLLLVLTIYISKYIPIIQSFRNQIFFMQSSVISILIVGLLHLIYLKSFKRYKKILLYFMSAFYCLWICETNFDIVYYFNHKSFSTFYMSFYILPYLAFVILLLKFWVLVVKTFLKIKKLFILISITFAIILVGMFISELKWNISLLSYIGCYEIVTIFLDVIIFYMAAITLIRSHNKVIDNLSLGTMMIVTSNLCTKYLFLTMHPYIFDYSELFHIIGLLIILNGALFLYKNPNRKFIWYSTSSLKVQISLFIYLIFIISSIGLFFLAKGLGIISNEGISTFPILILIYSILIIYFSNLMGQFFAAPFKELERNIQTAVLAFEEKYFNYNNDEFNKLHKFIIKQLKINDHNIKLQKNVNHSVISAMHDIRSPLTALEGLTLKISDKVSSRYIDKLNNQLFIIKQIANDLLIYNKNQSIKVIDGKKTYCILTNLISSTVEQKILEWNANSCDIRFTCNYKHFIWIHVLDYEFKNMISNLLNNAYESMQTQKIIEIAIETIEQYSKIVIRDYGCGIPQQEIPNILVGKSFKHSGNGIGLSNAVKYVESLNGSLRIYSPHEAIGTAIEILIPIAKSIPPWCIVNNCISLGKKIIVIISTDRYIIRVLQKIFFGWNLKPHYFVNSEEFISWYKSSYKGSEIIVFTDHEQENSVNLMNLQHLSLKNVFVISHYAEQSWLQAQLNKTPFILIPKTIIDKINFSI